MGRLRFHGGALRAFCTGVLLWTLLFLVFSDETRAQETSNITVLEPDYRRAQGEHLAAYNALVALEGRLNQANEDFARARAAGDEAGAEEALSRVLQLSGEQREATLRLKEKAGELTEARTRLIRAYRLRVDELITQVASTQDPGARQELRAILQDANNRRLELLAEEEPETALEPLTDLTISPTDTPRDIRRMADLLDYRAQQNEAWLEGIDQKLEELRQDLRRSRRVSDFLSDMERFGDTRLPVGPPGTTTPPPDPDQLPLGADSLGVEPRPMTLEERIRSLEILRLELEERIQLIRNRAARFREIAGRGGVA
jgi:hypothetical protein